MGTSEQIETSARMVNGCHGQGGEGITEGRQVIESLRESEQLHGIILNNIVDTVFITDDDGCFTFVCPNVSAIFGYDYEEVIAFGNIDKLLGNDLFETDRLNEARELCNIEREVRDKSGRNRVLLVNVKRVSIKDGTLLYTCHEITERKKAQAAQKKQKEYLNTLLETIPNPVFYKDNRGKYTGCNKAFEEFVGKPRSEIIGRTVYEFGPKEIADRYHEMDMALFKNPGKQHYEWKVQGAQGAFRDVVFDKATIMDPGGDVDGLVGVISDITERTRSERALRESESTLKAILAASPIGICLIRDRIIRWTNQALSRIWGYEKNSLEGKRTRFFYPSEEAYERVGNAFYNDIRQKGIGKIETEWIRNSGEKIHCCLQGCFLDPSDPDKGIIVAVVDITERKRAEDLVRSLSHRLIEAQENERKMISYELHDCIAQNLSCLKIDCDTFFNGQSDMPDHLIKKAKEHSNLIMQTINAVRELSYGLHPPSLEALGLKQTLSQLCEELAETADLDVEYIPTGLRTLKPDPLLEINIYRLIQEGFTNIRKHARATHVKLVVIASHTNITLRIEDNGMGLQIKAREEGGCPKVGMGIRNMTERVNLLHGKFSIKTKPGHGTQILARIPILKSERADGLAQNHHLLRSSAGLG
jgi:PAS domain S-box-containing protein